MSFQQRLLLFFIILTYLRYTICKRPLAHGLYGTYRGRTQTVNYVTVHRFLGIPYADPPIKDLRFKKPRPVHFENFDKILNAHLLPPSCVQKDVLHGFGVGLSIEDCLYLNIWTPRYINNISDLSGNDNSLPVLFFIHGGAFVLGSIVEPVYDGSVLASRGIVVVTINYRLGILGGLYSGRLDEPGNQMLHDQLLALQWINVNVQFFGGNPNRVTLAGESAGAISVSDLISSKSTHKYFNSVIMTSGSILTPWFVNTKQTMLIQSKRFAQTVGCYNVTSNSDTCPAKDKVDKSNSSPNTCPAADSHSNLVDGQKSNLVDEQHSNLEDDSWKYNDGLPLSDETMKCLRNLNYKKFATSDMRPEQIQIINMLKNDSYNSKSSRLLDGREPITPMIDGDILEDKKSSLELLQQSAESLKHKRFLIGSVNFEGSVFQLFRFYKQLVRSLKKKPLIQWIDTLTKLIMTDVPGITKDEAVQIATMYMNSDPVAMTNPKTRNEKIDARNDFRFYKMLGDLYLSCPSYLEAQVRSNMSNSNIFYFHFTYRSWWALWERFTCPWGGKACHAMELSYFFGQPFSSFTWFRFSKQDRKVSTRFLDIISKFVTGQEMPWHNYDFASKRVLEMGDEFEEKTVNQRFHDNCDLLSRQLFKFPIK